MEKFDIQEALLKQISYSIPEGKKMVDVLAELLFISDDAAYRRLSGKVALSIFETQTLLDTFNISLGNLGSYKKDKIIFDYKSLTRIGLNFETYLTGLRDNLREVKKLKNPEFFISVNETPVFQLFNFPHLTRFKFFFWAKSYLKIPAYENEKFKREKIDKRVLQIGIEAHNLYNSFPTDELYCSETLRGILRQIEYYFESDLFEDNKYALELLDNVLGLVHHLKAQAEIGYKFARGNEPNQAASNKFNMYYNDTYLPDNTYYIKHDDGEVTYFSHNIMNFIQTQNPIYCEDTKMILDSLKNNSTLISVEGLKERNKFFNTLEKNVNQLKRKIEILLEDDY